MRRNILVLALVCLLHYCTIAQPTPETEENAAVTETEQKKVSEANVKKLQDKESDVTTEPVKDGETETPKNNDTKTDAATNGKETATNDTQTTSVNGTNTTDSGVTIEFSMGPTEYIKRIPCHCVTRGPISKFKLYGNIHFPKIKVTPERYVTVPTEPSSTVCPPCECPACPSQNDLF